MNLNILIVDDEPELRKFLNAHLSPPNSVTMASSGAEGIRLMSENNFHLLLTDIQMPGIDGFKLLHTAKLLDPHCEVILMSGQTEYEEVINAVNEEAFAFLKKPLRLDALARRLRQVALITRGNQEQDKTNSINR